MNNQACYLLSNNLKHFRKKAKLTQKELSELSEISFSMISKIESGEQKNPTLLTISKLADSLCVPISEFFIERVV